MSTQRATGPVPQPGRVLTLAPQDYTEMGRPGETDCVLDVVEVSQPYRQDGSLLVDVKGYRVAAGLRAPQPSYLTVRLGSA